ncbi:hypothetical protein BD560DRAFT_464473 [Blakeslea trispora]|nr:hypothetical protein BD560DRAFT_464473 [Blakeslea trispora]
MSLKSSKTTHSSVENSIEGIKHTLEVILTKVSAIESKCEGMDRRMDELEATVAATATATATATVSATVAAAAAQVTSSTPAPKNTLIPLPRGNIGKAEVLRLLQTSLEDEDEASVLKMLNCLDREALLVCQSFANVDNNSKRTWREVLAKDQNSMKQQLNVIEAISNLHEVHVNFIVTFFHLILFFNENGHFFNEIIAP